MSSRDAYLLRTYGITEATYQRILDAQGNVCGICGKPPGKIRLAVDHHHKTGLLRGLLCSWCNYHVIGAAKDSAALHEAAAEYLRNPPAQRVIPGARAPERKK